MRRIALLLTAATGTVALLAFFYPSLMVNAADTTPPETTITSPLDGSVIGTTVTFEFTSSEPGSTFECKLVGQDSTRTNCTSPKTYINLKAGTTYTFKVWAIDAASNIDTTPATLTFTPSGSSGGTDTTPPETTITSPLDGSVIGTTVTFEFTSSEPGSAFECKLVGQDSTRTNCTSPKTYINLKAGTTYTFKVWAIDAASNIDTTPATLTFTPSGSSGDTDTDGDGVPDSTDECDSQPGPAPSGCPLATSSAILVGAGDISSGGSRDQETGDLVRAQLSGGAWGVFTTGDNAYPDGTYQNYQVYNAAWGSFKDKTRPAFGNHDYYGSSSAQGANQYWNESPAVPVPGGFTNSNSYYSYDIPNTNWRGIVLNSASTEGPTSNQAPSCEAGSPQIDFLNNALNTTKNTVLFWHHARFSASTDHPTSEGATGCSKTFFDVAYDKRADLVVQGHSHLYERYETRDKTGTKAAGGLTSIVCGLGGNSSDGLQGSPSPAYDKAFTNAWGVCKLTLNTNNAQVDFLHAPNSPGADSATVAVRP